jgi:MFS family permease
MAIVLTGRFSMSTARSIAGVVTALYLEAQGFSGLAIGALFVAVTAVSAVLSTAVGLLSDRTGRRPFLVAVPLLAAGAAWAYATSDTPTVLVVAAALGSFGRGAGAGGGTVGPYQPAESALVAESVPAANRASAFGGLTFASVAGALAGGLLATLAGGHHVARGTAALLAYRPAFVAAGVLAAVAGVVALLLPSDRRTVPAATAARPAERPARRHRIRWPRRSWPALWRLSLTNAVNGLGIGLFGPFVSYWLSRRYGVGPGSIGVLFAIVNVASLASALGAAWVGRRLGTVRAIVVIRMLTGALLVPMALAPSFVWAGAIFVVRMVAQRLALPLRQSFSQDLAHPEERASVAALSTLPSQVTMAGSQALAGYLFDEVSLAAPMELAACFQCLNAVLYATLFRRVRALGSDAVDRAPPSGAPTEGLSRADPARARRSGRREAGS